VGYYDSEDKVEQYVGLAEGYDGAALIERLSADLAEGSTVLEIGMGPGKDLALLSAAGFKPTGSDRSQVFLQRYRQAGGPRPILHLDAVTLETDQTFDAIYSNKVLHHLTREEMAASMRRQAELIPVGGLIMHALWHGDGEEHYEDMLVTNYTLDAVHEVLPEELELIDAERYAEMEDGDSLWILLQRIVPE